MKYKYLLAGLFGIAAMFTSTAVHAQVRVQAGGATFPDPIYQKWITAFNGAGHNATLSYAATGSGAGISGLIDRTIDFAGSDAPMNKDELAKARDKGGEVVEIPSVAGAVVLAYNLPGFSGDLKLSGPVVADMYLGKISKWNDPAIAALNPGVSLPDTAVQSVHRSDGSGTNYVFTSYLCTQSDEFQTKVNFGKTVEWPKGGEGAAQNAGVTQAISRTPGAVGYIELNFAVANKISYAIMQNDSGKFVKASTDSVQAAGEGTLKDMDDQQTMAVRLWARDGDNAYPISSFTYLICYKDLGYLKDKAKAQAIVDYFWYATHDGQKMAKDATYAPLSDGVVKRAEAALATVTFDGQALTPNK